jgi:hypothetical protein
MDVMLSFKVSRAALRLYLALIREASVPRHFITTFKISTDYCVRMRST